MAAGKEQTQDDESANPFTGFIPTNRLMAIAWAGSMQYCLGDDAAVAAFRRDTGCTFTPGLSALDRMIDDATGANFDFLKEFAAWHNQNVWGFVQSQTGPTRN